MANKDRQKRSVRKARAAERKELEGLHAASAPKASDAKKSSVSKAEKAKAPQKGKSARTGLLGRVSAWFSGVHTEMRRVVWPTKAELRRYAGAVIAMLVVFGVAVWLIDTGVVAALVGYSSLRG